jgi:hypothetical protein
MHPILKKEVAMRRALIVGVVALLALGLTVRPAGAVPFSAYGVPNTFGGAAVAEDAGWAGAAGGTQANFWTYNGAEVSLDVSGAPIVNLPQADARTGIPTPAGAIFETTQVKDGSTISFGQELTAVMGALFPTYLVAVEGTGADNGLAPGSAAADGSPDELTPSAVTGYASFRIGFGPASSLSYPYASFPVFEIYDDVPPTLDLDIGAATTTLVEEMFDFDGAVPNAAVPPPTAVPSQFENTGDGYPAPNDVSAAIDGTLWASGYVDGGTAQYTFFDPTVIGSSGVPVTVNGQVVTGYVYRVDFNAVGVITDGVVLPMLAPLGGLSSQGDPINITFTSTLYGIALPETVNNGQDAFAAWNVRTTLAGNSGDASFTVLPTIPEPTTMALFGLSLGMLWYRKKK